MDITLEQLDIKQEQEPEIGSTEVVFETVDLPSKSNLTRSIAIWSNEETKKLVELYKAFMTDIGPYNRFKRKKDMWAEISSHIPNMSAKQCEERLKTIHRRKKKETIEKIYLTDAKRKFLDSEDEEIELNIPKQKSGLETVENITHCKSVPAWSSSETRLLVGLYKCFIYEVGLQKKFKHKRDMWAQIAANFDNKDPIQCEQRFYSLFKRKKTCLTKSHANKARRKTIDFRPRHFAEANPLKNNNIEEVENDVITEDILKPQEKEECTEPRSITPANADNIELFSINETLKEIAAKKEAEKERRHREKMEAVAKFQNSLLQMFSTKRN